MLRAAIPAAVLVTFSAPVRAQEPPSGRPVEANVDEEVVQPTGASAVQVEGILARYEEAEDEKDALLVAEALAAMGAHTNEEFLDPALDGMKYRASSVDKKAAKAEAKELGIRGKKEIDALVEARVAEVQAAAAMVLASVPGKDNAKVLMKALKDGDVQEGRPAAARAILEALGRMEYTKAEGEVLKLLQRWGDPQVSKACVRFFGQVKTKDYDIVRFLCEQLEGPKPAWVDDPTNPPASYWEARWKSWQAVRRDVTWSLHEITGQTFRAQEGDTPGESKRALDYIKEHKKALGLS